MKALNNLWKTLRALNFFFDQRVCTVTISYDGVTMAMDQVWVKQGLGACRVSGTFTVMLLEVRGTRFQKVVDPHGVEWFEVRIVMIVRMK